jgi:hypothetical protein
MSLALSSAALARLEAVLLALTPPFTFATADARAPALVRSGLALVEADQAVGC